MSKNKKYIFNPQTLSYEVVKRSKRSRFFKTAAMFVVSLGMAGLYFWLYSSVLGLESPKLILLKKENAAWNSKIEVLNRQLDGYDEALTTLQMRDDDIYRSIFGMYEIPEEVREAGFGGVNRYAHYDVLNADGPLKNAAVRLDVLTKKTFVQSRSFDEVAQLSKKAGDMASCIPAIPPVVPDRKIYHISSRFGYRTDPFTGKTRRHSGIDFALMPGNPIYVTGDGVVESVRHDFYGYGNQVLVDHGFGYKTRYAHLKTVDVVEGMTLKRGEKVGTSGNSGRSSGPHLHYEVIYRDQHMNPANYFDLDITPEEYAAMVKNTEAASDNITLHPSHQKPKGRS
ncbi:MAG: M23 family metallopeptidase [Bacteroidales bacterium]|nr:M23 family metallopeptidase [Bacteroidales bacterium]